MKKIYVIFILFLFVIIGTTIGTVVSENIAKWEGWTAIAAISALLTSFGIIFLVYQFILQKRGYSLEQIKFLMELSKDFIMHEQKYLAAWKVLRNYSKCPKEILHKEWEEVCDALRNCYESVLFLYQIAQLVNNRMIDSKILYLFYYEKITGYSDAKLSFLIQWCGTGIDLAANYDSYELGRIIIPIKNLIILMESYHKKHINKHVAKQYNFVIDKFKEMENQFIPNLSKYDVSSKDYIDNYISIIDNDNPN